MEFGIFSNARRPTRALSDAWDRDIFEIEIADKLGFREAWISEHQSPAELIICKAAGVTKQIKLGSGGAADRLLPSVADRDRGQCLRPAYPWPLPARRRLRFLPDADGAARARFRQDARHDACLDRADLETLDQQGAGRLRRPVLDRQRDGGEARSGAKAAPGGRNRLVAQPVFGRARRQVRPVAADRQISFPWHASKCSATRWWRRSAPPAGRSAAPTCTRRA